MRRRVGPVVAALLLAGLTSGCSWDEQICSEGEHPVRNADGGFGTACGEDGKTVPKGYATYPPGKVPKTSGDKWDEHWASAAARVEAKKATAKAIKASVPYALPNNWKRVDLGGGASMGLPPGWRNVSRGDGVHRLARKGDLEPVNVKVGPADRTLDQEAKALFERSGERIDNARDRLSTPIRWPGAKAAHYVNIVSVDPISAPGRPDSLTRHEVMWVDTASGQRIQIDFRADFADKAAVTQRENIMRTLKP